MKFSELKAEGHSLVARFKEEHREHGDFVTRYMGVFCRCGDSVSRDEITAHMQKVHEEAEARKEEEE